MHKQLLVTYHDEERHLESHGIRRGVPNEQWKEMPANLNLKQIDDVKFLPLTSFPSDKDADVIL